MASALNDSLAWGGTISSTLLLHTLIFFFSLLSSQPLKPPNKEKKMWRLRSLSCLRNQHLGFKPQADKLRPLFHPFYSTESSSSSSQQQQGKDISFEEAKKLMRLVNVEALKRKLGMEGDEVIGYSELLKACESMGVARSLEESKEFARVLDEAGVVLLFRDKVYLHPHKVVDLVRKAVPLALAPDDDPRKDELQKLQKKKEEIDMLAHKQVRRILWAGLGFSMVSVGLFFRLTFWEFSWDVMEPIAFFTTTTGLVVGYAYFLFTSRDPTYQDFRMRLFLNRQKKLCKQQCFDVDRFMELQKHCKSPLELGCEDTSHH